MNSVVAITGANKGLGLELARQLLASKDTSKVYGLCRKSSPALDELAANSNGMLVVVDKMDVSNDGVVQQLQDFFKDQPINLLIHNAGASGPPEKGVQDPSFLFESQSLANVTMDRMRFTFELNTLGPLRVTQALLPNLKKNASAARDDNTTTKVIIISSAAGSISAVKEGGLYSYRTSKAAVNMIGKNIAGDLKEDGIAVGMIHPGTVDTGIINVRSSQHRDVDVSVKGILIAIDGITLDNTGAFVDANYGEGVKPIAW